MASYGKVLNMKVVRIVETCNFPFGAIWSDIPYNHQTLKDPGPRFLPDGSDQRLKMMPEISEDGFI